MLVSFMQLHKLMVLPMFSRHRLKMLNDSKITELLSFLTIGTRADVKDEATGYLLGLSGNR